MSIALPVIIERAPEKPKWGEPCNGCGFCCAAEPCDIAREFIGATKGPCPAMEFDAGRFWCGMVRSPHKYLGVAEWVGDSMRAPFQLLLGVGRGCDSEDPEAA